MGIVAILPQHRDPIVLGGKRGEVEEGRAFRLSHTEVVLKHKLSSLDQVFSISIATILPYLYKYKYT